MINYLMEPFILRALLGGVGVALVAGPLGCFVVWQRMAYFGDSLAHSALLGIALGVLLGIDLNLGILLVGVFFALLLSLLQHQHLLATDTLLGILSHSALALGIVVFSFFPTVRMDLFTYLFGDVLAITWQDIAWIYGGALAVVGVIIKLWRSLLLTTIQTNLAQAEGVAVGLMNFILMLLIAIVVAVAMQIVGILLITALLVIPAATARSFARSPEQMALYASLVGMTAVILGLIGSITFDTPSGPSIVVVTMLLFLVSLIFVRSQSR